MLKLSIKSDINLIKDMRIFINDEHRILKQKCSSILWLHSIPMK